MRKKQPKMHLLLYNKSFQKFIAVSFLISSLLLAFLLMSIMFPKLRTNDNWSLELSAAYYGVVRAFIAILVIM